jgi:hypothetical protein
MPSGERDIRERRECCCGRHPKRENAIDLNFEEGGGIHAPCRCGKITNMLSARIRVGDYCHTFSGRPSTPRK